jgi:LmbE family N-acetylglucosaminyl deacetylase
MNLFVSPHCDDETLFGAFTLLREKPLVVIVYDGYVQQSRGLNISADQRTRETQEAMKILGVDVEFLGLRDDDTSLNELQITNLLESRYHPEGVFIPAVEIHGHRQHNLVGRISLPVIQRYMTYTDEGKSTSNNPVKIEDGSWVAKKLRAMACYESQMTLDSRCGCLPHFLRPIHEYYL